MTNPRIDFEGIIQQIYDKYVTHTEQTEDAHLDLKQSITPEIKLELSQPSSLSKVPSITFMSQESTGGLQIEASQEEVVEDIETETSQELRRRQEIEKKMEEEREKKRIKKRKGFV